MHFCRRSLTRWFLLVLAVAANLPAGRSQRRTTKPPSRRCSLTVDEVDALTALLEDIERPMGEESEEAKSDELADAATTQCTRELLRLRNSVRRLQETYQKLKEDTSTVNMTEYQHRKNRYEQQKLDLTAKLNGLESQVNSQHRSQIGVLRKKIKELEGQLNTSVTQLDRQRQDNLDHYINLVATQVDRGRSSVVVYRNFEQLMKYSSDPYAEIVKRVSKPRNMINFLRMVDFQHQPVAGYETLVSAMIEHQTLRGDDAVELLKHIQSLILARDGQQQERALALLKKFKMNAH